MCSRDWILEYETQVDWNEMFLAETMGDRALQGLQRRKGRFWSLWKTSLDAALFILVEL
ncbi:hypothetical protein BDFB_009443 [Asbolus verrucosus]|uniref:Uncharacterized protein n=1 Tax=Asbolus verrucosus TaxID=1661398 RepID=A0A482W0H5_ASBVE|nr:hypothetical protein BDFB_009443 [Asbolus verrucosus]